MVELRQHRIPLRYGLEFQRTTRLLHLEQRRCRLRLCLHVRGKRRGYTYKTVFEIFVAKANLGDYVNAEEVPLMVSAVTDGGWGWILDPWVNATQPNTVTRTDFVRK